MTPRAPRILGILSAAVLLYGAWLIEPRWITGALGLLVLYAVLTHADRATALIGQADAGLRAIIAPTPTGGGGSGKKKAAG